ncbi:hypothetical protein SLS53_004676 [Cytospora paraplurivora]|uniref:Dihydrofolate reductase n=1 Tax=Cytospora paraplurivora TaxID=2898453 RepID=A0AAN9YG42_9PEZI
MNEQLSPETMPPLELTLVLAATRDMGIGMRGTLPWTGLRKEMAYFARVTKRLPPSEPSNLETDPVKASSLEHAIAYLRERPLGSLGRIFVIGGGQIYASALEMKEARRILLTKVMSDFECDTSFSLKLSDDEPHSHWAKRSKQELDSWTGEVVPEGIQIENDTSYEYQMWERTD